MCYRHSNRRGLEEQPLCTAMLMVLIVAVALIVDPMIILVYLPLKR